jgi:hypothetical protein
VAGQVWRVVLVVPYAGTGGDLLLVLVLDIRG